MDSLGSLALATDGPSPTILDAQPVHPSASLMNPSMMRNVILVSTYESIIILITMFAGLGDKLSFVPQSLMTGYPAEYED